jgi:hypothetical protein
MPDPRVGDAGAEPTGEAREERELAALAKPD